MKRKELFYKYVSPDPLSGCWIWTGCADRQNYGRFWDGEKMIGAHVFSATIANKAPTIDKPFILHACNNPGCVNPDHLRPGTALENFSDRRAAQGGKEQRDQSKKISKCNNNRNNP